MADYQDRDLARRALAEGSPQGVTKAAVYALLELAAAIRSLGDK